ncbi:MAG TPA: glycogen debranching N-terminal domain-containing protein [Nitrospiraceae bacterium]|nr:glycogen debranching N-terminal domain-containing protein [Nitrospiraceae bacterium]
MRKTRHLLRMPTSRRTFLVLPFVIAWSFGFPSLSVQRLVALQPERKERKPQLLGQRRPSETSGLADAIVIKDADVFFLTEPNGNVPLQEGHGFGLYFHDCRYLNGYEIRLAGMPLVPLAATAGRGFMAKFELANPKMKMANGGVVQREEIEVQWHRIVDSDARALDEWLSVHNFSRQPVDCPLSMTFRAEFEDVYAVRGFLGQKFGTLQEAAWKNGALQFLYEGKDAVYRSLSIYFSPVPDKMEGTTAHFAFKLAPREAKQVRVALLMTETPDRAKAQPARVFTPPDVAQLESKLEGASEKWLDTVTDVFSDSLVLEEVIDRSFRDLQVLRMKMEQETFFAAGTPWFATLFGRDSVITALQTLAYDPGMSEQTLRLLARYQGQRVDEWKDEQPGKILHELRVGEAARTGLIPHTPYYGSIDATPLFLILVGRHAEWTGTLALFNELRTNIERALEWMAKYGERDGYLTYSSSSEKGLENQGWKDSGDGIINADGTVAVPPIAVVEAQGYAYRAKIAIADLYERAGEPSRAHLLRREAADLQRRFNHDFWLRRKGFYALALQHEGKAAAVVSSNPGHALWTGIVDHDKARQTVERLMRDDMFSGWGIRTLSQKESAYNPLGYHLGSVWPHDTSLIAAGFRRYGFDDDASRLFEGLLRAATHFKGYQLPELFGGFNHEEYDVPVPYPGANHPQAWASGSIPYMLQSMLGLRPEAFEQRLRIVRPMLPDFIDEVELHRLRVGEAQVDLRFERNANDVFAVRTLRVTGRLDVVVSQ